MTADTILNHLDKVRSTGPGKWLACCPAHDDRSPSLSIRETDTGSVLLYCFAGCGAAEIIEAIGLSMSDLFPSQTRDGKHSHRPKARRITSKETIEALKDDLLAMSLAFSDFAEGAELSPDDARYISKRAMSLVDVLREVQNDGR